MSKEQINYLLALATLIVVWLYFNTFYSAAKRNYGGGPGGGMMAASGQRFPNPMGMQNIQQPPNITELLKNQRRGWQPPAAPGETPPTSSDIPQKDKTR
ncbi:MAG: hypothetical protein ABH891_08895 [Candidatus Omnitrophota bacterium]